MTGTTPVETCTSLPFGDGQTCTGTSVSPIHFTGKERDSESDNDYFGARYYISRHGRWLTPDWSARQEAVPYADLANPQTLNLYAYVSNNPVSHTDLDGHAQGTGIPGVGYWWKGETLVSVAASSLDATFASIGPQLMTETQEEQQQAQQQQQQQPQQQQHQAQQQQVVPVSARAEANNVIITYSDGRQEVRTGGSRSWRNNNPGNLIPGDFANRQGAIGQAGGIAVFPNEAVGQRAQVALLLSPRYRDVTLDQAIARWAPPPRNPTAAYQAYVRNATGISGQTRINTLNDNQINSVANAIRTFEGWRTGTVIYRRP